MIKSVDEARHVIGYCEDRHMDFFNCRHSEADYKAAESYLAALQGPEVKALEKMLELMAQELRTGTGYRIGSGVTGIWLSRIYEALAQYREAINP